MRDVLWRIAAGAGVLVLAATVVTIANLGRLSPTPGGTGGGDSEPVSDAAVTEAATTDPDAEPPAPDSDPTPAPATSSPVDSAWLARVAAATGIPARALQGYASAELAIDAAAGLLGVGWNTLAGLGQIESGHGTHGRSALDIAGYPVPAIIGPALDGGAFGVIRDTDAGAWDGDATWDRAVGPLQFIPSTWARWGADGNGDGIADPNQIDDAALTAARYLCASGSMTTPSGWRAAVFSYNHLDSYVDAVAGVANHYADAARTAP